MTTIRPFTCDDLFHISKINIDPFTETYNIPFYMHYLVCWPDLCLVAEDANGRIMGYILGKTEGEGTSLHGHVTAVTTDPDYRRIGVATELMRELETICDRNKCHYVDLFVRVSNVLAVETYKKFGYVIYRRVVDYYSGEVDEDAYDMRKPLSIDVERRSIRPTKFIIRPEELSSEDV